MDEVESVLSTVNDPEQSAVNSEQRQLLCNAIGKLLYDQKEVLILHLQGGMMFKQIARLQRISKNTAWSRYRYALEKLRLLLDSEMTP